MVTKQDQMICEHCNTRLKFKSGDVVHADGTPYNRFGKVLQIISPTVPMWIEYTAPDGVIYEPVVTIALTEYCNGDRRVEPYILEVDLGFINSIYVYNSDWKIVFSLPNNPTYDSVLF